MKVLAVLIILLALVIIIVPQFTNCEADTEDSAMAMGGSGTTIMASTALPSAPPMESAAPLASAAPVATATAGAMPYRMMKCYWTAHAEIVVGIPLSAIGVLLFFARRRETTRVLGILTAILGVLTILLPTSIIGTCLNDEMVCNTEMKPVLLITGGIVVALGIAVVAVGQMKREIGGNGGVTPA